MVDDPLGKPSYDLDYVRANETVLRRSLLDTSVAAGFDAARSLWMYERACDAICHNCTCVGDPIPSATSPELASAQDAAVTLAKTVARLALNASTFDWGGLFSSFVPPAKFHGATAVTGINYDALRQAMFADAMIASAPGMWSALQTACSALGTQPTAAQLGSFANTLAGVDLTAFDKAIQPDSDLQKRLQAAVEARVRSFYVGQAKATIDGVVQAHGTGNPIIDAFFLGWATLVISEQFAMDLIVGVILSQLGQMPGFTTTNDLGIKGLAQTAAAALKAWIDVAKTRQTAADQAFSSMFPPSQVLAARERFDALVHHLKSYSDYYAFAVMSDLISRNQLVLPPALLAYRLFIAPQPVAVVAGRLAYAIDLSSTSQFAPVVTAIEAIIASIQDDGPSGEVTLPTPGFVVEPKLSNCSACEGFVEKSRHIELELRKAQADQAKYEASRREKRLVSTPPNLDPFDPGEPTLKIDLQQTSPPSP
jgi:hypothetical protein